MHVINRHADRRAVYPAACRSIVSLVGAAAGAREITTWPGYRPTPLTGLPEIAGAIGVAAIWYKNEAHRFGLNSFKALGGAYAVQRLLSARLADSLGHAVASADLLSGMHAVLTREVTVCCATDGNHGRSVAWAAQIFGCAAVIHLHETVSQAREDAIAAFGARIVRCPGTYDDAVRRAAADAEAYGWQIVSDTSYPGYLSVPCDVMQGYTVLVDEAVTALPDRQPPTHVFIQAGVGGFAAAVCGHLWELWGDRRPVFVVVEPEAAPCIFDSIAAGEPRNAAGALDTIMAGLACGEPSVIGWEILAKGADHALTIPDSAAMDCMRLLAAAPTRIVAGESGVAGLAGLLHAAGDSAIRAAVGLDAGSRILVVGTEGATDPALYREIVGIDAEDVVPA